MLGGTGLLLGVSGQYLVVLGCYWVVLVSTWWLLGHLGTPKEHFYLRLIGASFIKI